MGDVELCLFWFFSSIWERVGGVCWWVYFGFWFLWVPKCCGGVGEELHNTKWEKASDIYCSALKLRSTLRGRIIQIRPTCFWPWKCQITTWEHHNLTEWICYSSNLAMWKLQWTSKLVHHRCKMDKETVPDTASWELLKLQKFSRACLIPLSHPCCQGQNMKLSGLDHWNIFLLQQMICLLCAKIFSLTWWLL